MHRPAAASAIADIDRTNNAMKPAEMIMQMASGLWVSRAIWAACRVGVPEAIGDKPTSIRSIAHSTGTCADMLGRLMNALAASGVFHKTPEGLFAHNHLSSVLRKDHPASQRAIVDIAFGDEHYEAWGLLDRTLKTGKTAFDLRYGMPLFGYFGHHPDRAAAFSEAMTSTTRMAEGAIIAAHRFKPFDLAVDVGGSQGSLLRSILERHHEARGIIFDLPEIVDAVQQTLEGTRITAEAGSFFESVPEGADLYLLKFILHDWTDEQSGMILANIRRAIRADGRLAILEMVLPEAPVPHPGWFMDLNMMAMTGGRERNVAGYESLLNAAGFKLDRVTPTNSPMSVVEAVPA